MVGWQSAAVADGGEIHARVQTMDFVAWARRFCASLVGRVVAALALLTIVYLSLAPAYAMIPRTDAPRPMEHFAAYAAVWTIIGLAFPWLRLRSLVAIALVLAGCLELAQFMSPGRTPSPFDFAGSALGAVAGLLLARTLNGELSRSRSAGA